jgi:GNAT superfamily N-acetyltransferase
MKKFKDFLNNFKPIEEDFTPGFKTFKHGHTSIDYSIPHNNPKHAEIHMVLTDKEHTGKGSARNAMNAFLSHTDKHGIKTHLTPEPLNTQTKKTKLTKFYKSLGYVPNRGKNKDFTTKSSMLREPKSN